MGKIYAQVSGHIQIIKKSKWNQNEQDKISVEPYHSSSTEAVEEGEESATAKRVMQPRTGDEVYARVMKVEDRFAKVDILAIGEDPIQSVFAGFIQQENVRDFDRSDV